MLLTILKSDLRRRWGNAGSCAVGSSIAAALIGQVAYWSAPAASAREAGEEFVAGLRDRGLDELALDYLRRMETSPLADAKFRQRIPYHRGRALITLARQSVDPDQRTELLKQARSELEAFAAANPDVAAGSEALVELANVFFDQAKQRMAESDQLPAGDAFGAERVRQRGEARRWFEEAETLFRRAESFYSAALDKIPKTLDPKTQEDLVKSRQEYRGRLAQVSVLAAQTGFEVAATYPRDSAEFRRRNEQAAGELARLFDAYSKWLVGFYARLYEGRCYQALGDYQRAQGCFAELISQPSVHPEFRRLIASAYGYQAECYVAKGEFDAAIQSCTAWLNEARDDERQRAEWLAVRYRLAEAIREKAQASATPVSQRRRLLTEAHDAYQIVAGSAGEFQRAARQAAAELRRGDDTKRDEPRDFTAAYAAGLEAMAAVNAAKLALPSAAKNNPSAIPELRLQMEQGKDDARRYFRLALTLVDDDVDVAQLNDVRYYLCWLSWENEEYYQAAVLGEFLARRYPEHPAAAAAAKLALAAYERLQQAAGGSSPDALFEARRMAEIAEFITRRWPGSQAAETAGRVLVGYAIRTDRVDDAKRLLDTVSESARPALEAQLGNAIWTRYLELSRRGENSPSDGTQHNALRREAVEYLAAGVSAARQSGRISPSQAVSALYLAQAMLSEERYTEAIAVLEDPRVGPLAVVERGHEAARPPYVVETYKAALRAYVSVTPPQAQKAVDTLERLEHVVATSGDQRGDQLTQTYVSLAVALGEEIQRLRDAGRGADADRLSGAFAAFLDQLNARQDGGSWASRYWVAQSYFNLAESLAATSSRETTQRYYEKSRDICSRLLTDAEGDDGAAPSPAALLAARKLLGECYGQLGEYQQALDAFSAVLKQQPAQMSVQRSAAATYQAWGEAGDVEWLERAIYGGYKLRSTGKNRIWGWLKLALVAERAARSNPSYRDAFFEARLEAARCRYQIGVRSSPAGRQQHFATAKQSIRSLAQLYPDLGGNKWRAQFESLLKQIQQALGDKKPRGLREFAAVN